MENTTPQTNPQLELAYQYVCQTDRCIFLTGKAGTGKTTFLHKIKAEQPKRMAVVAPTGVAAINAGGVTIHSLFQLPFGPYVPGNTQDAARQRKFSGTKRKLIRTLDLLVIDEISMVRADVLDGIDQVLRRYRHPFRPFGGVQLLMIGDLHQLPPVVKDEEWDLLRAHYATPYFFSSQALQQTVPVTIELKHIYRQSDDTFIRLLNKVRNNDVDDTVLTALNSRYTPAETIKEEDAYITLTTHNATANSINAEKLDALNEQLHQFDAEVSGDFPSSAYPADERLKVKVGAQVMFIKNDTAPEKRYYNGKIGKITRIHDGEIYVQCPGQDEPLITVGRVEWSNRKYTLNEKAKEVEEKLVGTFTQYPLRLAWAITIHKSQGLTFERVILDAQSAFAHGQVYVALSRCKTFEGIVLRSKIITSSVRTDNQVRQFSENAERNAPDEEQLQRDQAAFQQGLIRELFDFKPLQKRFDRMNRVLLEHENSLLPGAEPPFRKLVDNAQEELFPVAQKFQRQLQVYFAQGGLPEQNEELQQRIRKASAWFAERMENGFEPVADSITVNSDNQQVLKQAQEALYELQREVFIKKVSFQAAQKGFDTIAYQRLRANAELDFQKGQEEAAAQGRRISTAEETPHPELFEQLRAWRRAQGAQKDVPLFQILPTKTLLDIVDRLPLTAKQLKQVHGIGKARLDEYGKELLDLVQAYCDDKGVAGGLNLPLAKQAKAETPTTKAPKVDTKALSLQLYRDSKSIPEVAAERGLAVTTIEGHLAHFVREGELDVSELVDAEAIEAIAGFIAQHDFDGKLSPIKEHFGEAYSFGTIRLVVAHLEREKV